MTLRDWPSRVASLCFALAVAIGLVAAFVGLAAGSLWQDELYTNWIVDPAIGWSDVAGRAIRDVSPPLYYFLLWPTVQLLGDGEAALRLFSAFCAGAAILLFILGGKPFFSLRARLFAAAMATASSYWFMQAQNARFYALGLLASTAILLLALATLARPKVSRATFGLFAAMAAATFIHFYLLYLSLAVLLVLLLCRPQQRLAAIGFGGALLAVALLYVKVVISKLSYASTGANWIPNDAGWYATQLADILQLSLTHKAMIALAVCALAAMPALVRGGVPKRLPSSDIVLCVVVPLLVLAAAVASSLLVTPNFHGRYLLVVSPFLWALFAFFYDRGVAAAPAVPRSLAELALSAILVWMAVTMAANRARPYSEPFRETAAAIAALPECRGQAIPSVIMERRAWFRSDEGVAPIRFAYAKYLNGIAEPKMIYLEDILSGQMSDDWKQMLRRRIDGEGCPVLAWAVHTATPAIAADIGKKLFEATGRTDRASALDIAAIRTGLEGYVLRMKR